MNNNTSSSSPILYSDGGGVLNSGKIKIEGTSGKSYNLDDFSTVASCPFPVGFGGFFQTDPNTIYSGTKWAQKKDVFILAAGDTYAAGSTGGEAQHTLKQTELPGGTVINRKPTKEIQIPASKRDIISVKNSEWVFGSNYDFAQAEGLELYGSPHNNMPPYYTMPFWIRTA